MKILIVLIILCFLIVGCANYQVTFGAAFEHNGNRIEGTASFKPLSGKEIIKVDRKNLK